MDNTDLIRRLRDPLCTDTNDAFFMSEAATALEAAAKRIAELECDVKLWQDEARCGEDENDGWEHDFALERKRAEKAEAHAQLIAEAAARVERQLKEARAALRGAKRHGWKSRAKVATWVEKHAAALAATQAGQKQEHPLTPDDMEECWEAVIGAGQKLDQK